MRVCLSVYQLSIEEAARGFIRQLVLLVDVGESSVIFEMSHLSSRALDDIKNLGQNSFLLSILSIA